MKKRILLCGLLVLKFQVIDACTTAFLNKNARAIMVARSVDLFTPDLPQLVVNPRGMKRDGGAGTDSLKWQSKYGSVVITEFNSTAVSDGMNEKGLAAHLLYLTGSNYGMPKNKLPRLSNVIWAQYLLDNYKTVKEALQGMDNFQIVETEVFNRTWPLHLSLQDASGDAAIVEFIDGKKKVYHGSQYTTMTNEPDYSIQRANLKRYKSFGGDLPLPGDSDPLSRFVRVSTYLKTLPETNKAPDALAGILSVIRTAMVPFGAVDTSGNKTEDAWPTRWVSVADLSDKVFYFNSTTTPNIVWIELKDLDFSAGKPVLSLDPNNTTLVGNVKTQLH